MTHAARPSHVFIYGLARTGTTILWRCFRQDPQFLCLNEPFNQDLKSIVLRRENPHSNFDEYQDAEITKIVKRCWSHIPISDQVIRTVQDHQVDYLRRLIHHADRKGKVACFKLMGCAAKIEELREHFPHVHHILVDREPRAFASSHLIPRGTYLMPREQFFDYVGPFGFWQYDQLAQRLGLSLTVPAYITLMRVLNVMMASAGNQGPDFIHVHEGFCRNPAGVMKDYYHELGMSVPSVEYTMVKPANPGHEPDDPRWNLFDNTPQDRDTDQEKDEDTVP